MSAAEALKAARAAGIKLAIDGDDLVLEASASPPPAVIDRLTGHKTEIVAMLRPRRDGWSADDWQAFFDERAGFMEYDGRLSRAEAEARALACCIVEWLNQAVARGAAKPKAVMLLSCLTGRSPEPTFGYTLNAGQGGRTRVNLRQERLWLEWVSAAS
jgi:hypothetical protein